MLSSSSWDLPLTSSCAKERKEKENNNNNNNNNINKKRSKNTKSPKRCLGDLISKSFSSFPIGCVRRPTPRTDTGSSSITDNMITFNGISVLNFKSKRYSFYQSFICRKVLFSMHYVIFRWATGGIKLYYILKSYCWSDEFFWDFTMDRK
jgi:hypothetical protein